MTECMECVMTLWKQTILLEVDILAGILDSVHSLCLVVKSWRVAFKAQ